MVLGMFVASIIEAGIWAVSYMVVNAVPVFEHAFYFSIVTFTTLGYGDITLRDLCKINQFFSLLNFLSF